MLFVMCKDCLKEVRISHPVEWNLLIRGLDVLRHLFRLLGGGSDLISVGSNPLIRGFDALHHQCRLLEGSSDLNRCGIEPFESSDLRLSKTIHHMESHRKINKEKETTVASERANYDAP